MTTGKTIALIIQTFFSKVMYLLCNILSRFVIALTTQTFVGKVMSQLFNMLSRLVITFLPRSKRLFIATITICSDSGKQDGSQIFTQQAAALEKQVTLWKAALHPLGRVDVEK